MSLEGLRRLDRSERPVRDLSPGARGTGWGLLGTIISEPLALVILAGILHAVFLMGVAVATLYLAHTQTQRRTKDGKDFLVMLVITAVAVFLVGIVGLINL